MTSYSFITTDIETLNLQDTTTGLIPIIQIAAVAVPAVPVQELKYIRCLNDVMDYVSRLPHFSMTVKPLPDDGEIHIEVINFHLEQNDGRLLKQAATSTNHIHHAISCYYNFVVRHSPEFMYARPPQFDLTIIKNQGFAKNLKAPWNHWQERCERTLLQNYPKLVRPLDRYPPHDALADALWQTVVHLYSIQGVNDPSCFSPKYKFNEPRDEVKMAKENHNTDSDIMMVED